LQDVQRETGTCCGSARVEEVEVVVAAAAATATAAVPIEVIFVSQGRTSGLEVGVMGAVQVRV